MPRISCRLMIAAVVMALGVTAEAQNSEPCTLGVHTAVGFGMISYAAPGRTAPPFSGTLKATFEQMLPDGNSIHGVTLTHQARDSMGQTRAEFAQNCLRGPDGRPQVVLSVSVFDPTTKTSMNWLADNDGLPKVVRILHQDVMPVKQPSPAELAERQKMAQMRQPSKTEFRTEDLGTK